MFLGILMGICNMIQRSLTDPDIYYSSYFDNVDDDVEDALMSRVSSSESEQWILWCLWCTEHFKPLCVLVQEHDWCQLYIVLYAFGFICAILQN